MIAAIKHIQSVIAITIHIIHSWFSEPYVEGDVGSPFYGFIDIHLVKINAVNMDKANNANPEQYGNSTVSYCYLPGY